MLSRHNLSTTAWFFPAGNCKETHKQLAAKSCLTLLFATSARKQFTAHSDHHHTKTKTQQVAFRSHHVSVFYASSVLHFLKTTTMRLSASVLTAALFAAGSAPSAHAFVLSIPPSRLPSSSSTFRSVLKVASTVPPTAHDSRSISLVKGDDGVIPLSTPEEHAALLQDAADEIVVLKVFAPWCRACKSVAPKFSSLSRDPKLGEYPIRFASLSISHNKSFVKSLGVLALPTVQFYVKGQLVDTFSCGPSKFATLRRKLNALLKTSVDRETKRVIAPQEDDDDMSVSDGETSEANISSSDRYALARIPYLQSLSLADMDRALSKAVTLTFPPGAVIVREGQVGDTFYVLQTGEVEICQRTARDPMSGSYLGTVINQLGPGDFFGERALITGEPFAASVRAASDQAVTVLAFSANEFPASSVLSTRGTSSQEKSVVDPLNEKYGVQNMERMMSKQFHDLAVANQVRGSVHPKSVSIDEEAIASPTTTVDETMFTLVTRLQRIRHVSKCFRYLSETNALTDAAPGRRRVLVDRLTANQKAEFEEIFEIIDANKDGKIDLTELQRLQQSIGETAVESEDVELTFAEYM